MDDYQNWPKIGGAVPLDITAPQIPPMDWGAHFFGPAPLDFEAVETIEQPHPIVASQNARRIINSPTTPSEIDKGVVVDSLADLSSPFIPSGRITDNSLMALHYQNPFLEIEPPSKVLNVVASTTPQDITLPDGCQLCRMSGSATFFASMSGQAIIPTNNNLIGGGVIVNPAGWLNVRGIKQISISAASSNTIVSLECYSQE